MQLGRRPPAGCSRRRKRGFDVPKRTWQPKKRRRVRVHGFLARMSDRWGRAVVKARRVKGRKFLTVSDEKHRKG